MYSAKKSVFSALLIASCGVIIFAPSAFSEGSLEANSEASNGNGFPVLTGPGATVLTPDGSYVMPASQPKSKSFADDKSFGQQNHSVLSSIHDYHWGRQTKLVRRRK